MGNQPFKLQRDCKMCGLFNTQPVHRALFPMHVVKVSDFLEMTGKPEPHDLLKQKGLLHERKPGMFVVFVSHQWLGYSHPDEQAQHACVLRTVLRGMIDGTLNVEADVVSQSYGNHVQFAAQTREQVREGYLFLDWFAIPQITARSEGINEEVTKSDAALAVQSIPSYVEVSNLFVALVPEAIHQERGSHCNYTTWLSRGWCRAELWCHVLSNKPDTSIILVHSTKEVRFMFALDWVNNQISEGEFTVPSDRSVVVSLGELAVEHKLRYFSECGPCYLYRFYLANRAQLLGREAINWLPKSFLEQFRFASLEDAALEIGPMNGMLCAIFGGDCNMVRTLVEQRADANQRIVGMSDLGYYDSQTLLMVAAKSYQDASMLRCLIELRADVHATANREGTLGMLMRSPDHVHVVLEAKVNLDKNAGRLTALAGSAPMASTATVKALIDARCNVNPPSEGIGQSPLSCLVLFSRGNPDAPSSARLLLEARADPNATSRSTGYMSCVTAACRAYALSFGLEGAPLFVQHFASLPGSTALTAAAFVGDEALVRLLLEARADPLPNDNGHYPEDMARLKGHCHLLPLLSTFHV